MPIDTTAIAHLRLTVTDIKRSREFYDSVFGWPVFAALPENADAATREQLSFLFGGVIYNIGTALIGLRPTGTGTFDEDRVGLDHLAFGLPGLPDLEMAAAHLDALGIAHEPIKDIGVSYILEFRDPDNIALELTARK
ncbi:VOC family protein [Mycobacterium sp. CVI_P3]|uniref:VOC family protein n=1 Tax=Mycobacterium pinniadriaticum TaxID=2994102 RepID=A0ABT3SP06_9MYCO|nr:VOC family protein [Mycobacterium pinniadriaticum]MCX2934100.1 VOC family protein [Mycobacterium pinniadriaticum]MCX2940522.1 VOC family protein [Mycobacterium pinniadriaticum]